MVLDQLFEVRDAVVDVLELRQLLEIGRQLLDESLVGIDRSFFRRQLDQDQQRVDAAELLERVAEGLDHRRVARQQVEDVAVDLEPRRGDHAEGEHDRGADEDPQVVPHAPEGDPLKGLVGHGSERAGGPRAP